MLIFLTPQNLTFIQRCIAIFHQQHPRSSFTRTTYSCWRDISRRYNAAPARITYEYITRIFRSRNPEIYIHGENEQRRNQAINIICFGSPRCPIPFRSSARATLAFSKIALIYSHPFSLYPVVSHPFLLSTGFGCFRGVPGTDRKLSLHRNGKKKNITSYASRILVAKVSAYLSVS